MIYARVVYMREHRSNIWRRRCDGSIIYRLCGRERWLRVCMWSRRSAMKYALVYSPVLHWHGKTSLRDAFKGGEAALKLVKNTPGQVFSPVVNLLLCKLG